MTIKALLLKGFGFLVAFLWTVSVLAQCDQQQRELDYIALRALYLSTDGDNWEDNTGWPNVAFFNVNPTLPNAIDVDSWYGVRVNVSGCVTCIDLDGTQDCGPGNSNPNIANGLNGNIPPEIGNLSQLTELRLSRNPIGGNIPPEIGNLTNLTVLNLYKTQLNGSIPPELGNLTNLTFLWLGTNDLTGSIPAELGNLVNLTELQLSYNDLTGSIPSELGNLNNLERIFLGNNDLSGIIPPQLQGLSSLRLLQLQSNELTGAIPPEIGNLSNLEGLWLSGNDLCGCYGNNLTALCNQSVGSNSSVSNGNNFDAPWVDFCNSQLGICPSTLTISFMTSNPTCDNNDGIIQITEPTTGCRPYTYEWNNGSNELSLTGLGGGIYSVTVSDSEGYASTHITELMAPNPHTINNITPTNPSCNNNDGNITLNITGGITPYTYAWSNGITTPNLTNIAAGDYSVTVTGANGCERVESATLTLPTPPNITNITPQNPLCELPDGSLTITAIDGTAPYQYSMDGTNFQTANTLSGLAEGMYQVVVRDAENCLAMQSVMLESSNAVSLNLIPQNPDCYIDNGEISVEANNATPPLSYAWDDGQDEATAIGLSGGLHRVTVSDANGCSVTAATSLTAPVPPVIDLGEDRETCLPPDLTLSAGYPNSTWSTGATGATLQINDFGTYSVTATDNDCTDEDEITFTQKQITLDISPSADIAISPGEYTDISLYGADDYTWSPLDGLDFSNPANVRAQPENTTTYTITATTNDGCETTATLRVSIGLLPNVFNPTSGTLSLGIDDYENNELSIYNRWGIQVFHANPYLTSNEWDGTYKGKLVPTGNYYGVLELNVSEIEAEKTRIFIVY